MSEELLQRDLSKNPEKIGKWDFYNIGSTTIKALKEYGIIRNVDYGDAENKKVDALIVQKKNVIAIVEYKKPSQFKTQIQKDKAIQQEIEVARKLGTKIIIATDTKDTVWVNVLTEKRIKNENGEEIKTAFDPKSENIAELIEKINYSINEKNNNLKPKELVNPTDLAKQIWQDIWAVSGATPENCLYTFIELFIFKYLSDLDVLGQGINFEHLMARYRYNIENPKEEALEYYANIIRQKIKELFPDGKDGTTIINGTIFVSKDQKAVRGYSTVFEKVLQKFQKYEKLEHIHHDFKSQLFESFLKESISKKNWGQFFTPLKVVRAIVEMAKDDIKEGAVICDPACGVGKFLLEPIKNKLDYFYEIANDKIKSKITIHGFDKGFDTEEQKTIILAKANMLIYFSDLIKENPGLTKSFAQLFNESFMLKTNSILGTLSEPIEEKYDLILTNPPYVTSGSSNLKDEIKKDGDLVKYYKINAMGVEGLFAEWIIRALKPGGKAFIVIPDGILNRQNDKHLRQFMLDECYVDGLISLPIKTFFTTPKKTYILCITKKAKKEDIQKTPVFTYLVSEMGESRDVYRFDIEQNDLQEAVTLYSFFKGSKENFSKINSDNRCKIQPIDRFKPEEHWSIDRWWTKEEKIELGIEEEDNMITTEEFSNLIKDISSTLDEFSEIAKEVSFKKKEVTKYKEFSLNDKSCFELSIGKRIVKKDLIKFTGNIPIYSANVFDPIGYSKKSNIKDFKNNFVLWGIDGDFEFNAIPQNTPFITTDHCGAIRILQDNILPKYLMIQLETVKHKYGFDRGLRASLKNMSKVSVKIPVDESDINIEKQKEIIEKYNTVQEIKKQVKEYEEKINELSIEIKDKNYLSENINIKTLFEIKQGNAYYTKKRILGKGWGGDVPVYSSNTQNEGLLMEMELSKINPRDLYYQYCLTWSIDGYAGNLFIRNENNVKNINTKEYYFTINNHSGILLPKRKNISLKYIKYTLQPLFFEKTKGYGNKKLGTNQIIDISIHIPIKQNGEFDLKAQKEMAGKYERIEEIKKIIINELKRIEEIKIDYE